MIKARKNNDGKKHFIETGGIENGNFVKYPVVDENLCECLFPICFNELMN